MEEKLDYLDPLFIAAAIMAWLSDFAFLFGILGLAIPVVGFVLLFGVIGLHLFAGLFLLPIIFKLKHFVPKLILGLAIIIPLPILSLGMILAIVAQNRLVELVLTQAALAVTTAGAGNVVAGAAEGASVAAKGAQTLGAAAKGAEAVSGATKEAGVIARGAKTAGTKAERMRGKIKGKLEARIGELEQELGVNKENDVTEESFGIAEPTDKMRELFNPNFEEPSENDSGSSEESARRVSHWTPEPETGKEVYRRIDADETGENVPKARSENIQNTPQESEVNINEDTNEVNLKKAT